MSKIVKSNGCWLWQGPLDRDGYGSFYLRRMNRRAHRVGWYLIHGEIPDAMVVNHICGHRNCVNPQHLTLFTVRENSLKDSYSAGAINARKTHCPRGHAYDRRWNNQRVCSTCDGEKKRRLRARWRAENTLKV